MKKLFCVISNYNDLEWIDRCLGSLRRSEYPVQTIVVDDASTDRSCEKIKADYPEVELIECSENSGFATAKNIGINRALEQKADYLFLLDMDAWIEPDTINTLLNIGEKYSEYGVISPMHLNGSGTAFDKPFENYIHPRMCPGLLSDIYLRQEKDIYSLYFVNSAAWLVRREVFEIVGDLDESFYVYGPDDNFCDRVKYHDFKIGVSPKARIFHDRLARTIQINKSNFDYEKQFKKTKIVALNPNYGLLKKQFDHIRISFRNILKSLRLKDAKFFIQALKILFIGVWFNIKYHHRYL